MHFKVDNFCPGGTPHWYLESRQTLAVAQDVAFARAPQPPQLRRLVLANQQGA